MGRINTGRLGLKSDKHRGPTALGVYFFKPRPTDVDSTKLKPPRNYLFLKSTHFRLFNDFPSFIGGERPQNNSDCVEPPSFRK